MFDWITDWVSRALEGISRGSRRLLQLYHPRTLKEKGLLWSGGLLVVTYVAVTLVLGIYWSREPEPFEVRLAAREEADRLGARPVTGAVYTATLIRIGRTLLDKPGGYLSNDRFPPGLWLDNMPNWEFGALVMLRDGAQALRNHFSRSQSQSMEDEDLARGAPCGTRPRRMAESRNRSGN